MSPSATDVPGPLTPTRQINFPSKGETLYGEWFVPASGVARGLALMLHGYAEHCGRYRELANVLVADGYAVLGFDFRGHGQSSGRRGHIVHFTEYLDDLDAAIAKAASLAADSSVTINANRKILVAHSNGGLIALRALTDPTRAPIVVGVVITSPFLGLRMPVPAVKKLLARIASRIAPALSLPNEIKAEDLTSDTAIQAAHSADKLINTVATARWFTEAMAAQRYVAEHISRVAVPTLWLLGGADSIANTEISAPLARSLGAQSQVHVLDNWRHEVLNEVQRSRAFKLIGEYLSALPE